MRAKKNKVMDKREEQSFRLPRHFRIPFYFVLSNFGGL